MNEKRGGQKFENANFNDSHQSCNWLTKTRKIKEYPQEKTVYLTQQQLLKDGTTLPEVNPNVNTGGIFISNWLFS